MIKKPIIILSVIATIVGGMLLYFKCELANANSESTLRMAEEAETPAGINVIINVNNQFTFDLYSELRKEKGNIFFSPYNISTCLAMTYEGARGKTAEEMQRVFHFPVANEERRAAFVAIYNQINEPSAEYNLSMANALWAQNDYKFLEEYINTLQRYYAGDARNVDFKRATEEARNIINTWVEDKTNDKIKNLFPPRSLDINTRLVLTNAIYFKGQWIREFNKKQTGEEDFNVCLGNTVKAPMMRQWGEKFHYAETEDLQILEMRYKGDRLSMLILLPKNNDGLTSLESSLSLERLNEWKNKLKEQLVDVFMPKFTFDSKYFLKKTLEKLGMPMAFTKEADFSGMDGSTKNLYIQAVITDRPSPGFSPG